MRNNVLLTIVACGGAIFMANTANAQDAIVVEEGSVSVVEAPECKDNYYSTRHDNWFIQIGAGIQSPFVEYHEVNGSKKHHNLQCRFR